MCKARNSATRYEDGQALPTALFSAHVLCVSRVGRERTCRYDVFMSASFRSYHPLPPFFSRLESDTAPGNVLHANKLAPPTSSSYTHIPRFQISRSNMDATACHSHVTSHTISSCVFHVSVYFQTSRVTTCMHAHHIPIISRALSPLIAHVC